MREDIYGYSKVAREYYAYYQNMRRIEKDLALIVGLAVSPGWKLQPIKAVQNPPPLSGDE